MVFHNEERKNEVEGDTMKKSKEVLTVEYRFSDRFDDQTKLSIEFPLSLFEKLSKAQNVVLILFSRKQISEDSLRSLESQMPCKIVQEIQRPYYCFLFSNVPSRVKLNELLFQFYEDDFNELSYGYFPLIKQFEDFLFNWEQLDKKKNALKYEFSNFSASVDSHNQLVSFAFDLDHWKHSEIDNIVNQAETMLKGIEFKRNKKTCKI